MLWPPGEGGQDKAAAAVCMWPMRGGNGDRVEACAMSGLWRDWDGPAHGRHGPQSLFLIKFYFIYTGFVFVFCFRFFFIFVLRNILKIYITKKVTLNILNILIKNLKNVKLV